jgi:hypothetical protein
MAEAYKNAGSELTAALVVVYACPAGKTAIVQSIHVANKSAPAVSHLVTAEWRDSSAASVARQIGVAMEIPGGSALQMLDRPLVLESGDDIRALADTLAVLDITISVLEIT